MLGRSSLRKWHLSRDLKEDRSKKEREERALWAEGTVQRSCAGRGRGEDERLKEPRRSWSTETESGTKMTFKMWASLELP